MIKLTKVELQQMLLRVSLHNKVLIRRLKKEAEIRKSNRSK